MLNATKINTYNPWLALFFCLPKGIAERDSAFYSLPRKTPINANSAEYRALIKDARFLSFLKKAYAEALWKHLRIPKKGKYVRMYSELLQTDYGRALCHEDRQLLALRNEEYTYKELANVQNFSSHTGVINRLKHIDECLETKQPVSPRKKKLVPEKVQIHRREKKVALLLSKPTLWYRHVYLCSPSAFTLCRHCLKKIDPGKWDFCCPHYQKNGICAASDLSYIYHLHSRPRKRRVHAVREIKSFLPPPTEWWRV